MDTRRRAADAENYLRQLVAVCNNATVSLFIMDSALQDGIEFAAVLSGARPRATRRAD